LREKQKFVAVGRSGFGEGVTSRPNEHIGLADRDYVARLPHLPDEYPNRMLQRYADEHGLNFVEYWDDGEWHAQMIEASDVVAEGYGGNPREAHEALRGMLGLR
jgi:hypothetical protein